MFSGNALGYVRMIKSGGLNFCSIATSFIPNLKKVIQFEELCNNTGFSKHCSNSGHHLDNVIHNICQNIAEGTNYFKVIKYLMYYYLYYMNIYLYFTKD